MKSASLAITPLMLAERDREFLKQLRRNRDAEEKLMKDVEENERDTVKALQAIGLRQCARPMRLGRRNGRSLRRTRMHFGRLPLVRLASNGRRWLRRQA